MGQLKEVRTAAETMEKREGISAIYRADGRKAIWSLRAEQMWEKKVYTERESRLQKLQQLGASVLGFTEARGGGGEALAA